MGKAIWDGLEFIFMMIFGVVQKVFYYLICSLFGVYFLQIITLGEYPNENTEHDSKDFCLVGMIAFMFLVYILFKIKNKIQERKTHVAKKTNRLQRIKRSHTKQHNPKRRKAKVQSKQQRVPLRTIRNPITKRA